MAKYDKARIKLLDKRTGAVLKEVDPFTSSDAVDYKNNKTVYDELELLETFKNDTNTSITNINKKNEKQDTSIATIINNDKKQDTLITNINKDLTIYKDKTDAKYSIYIGENLPAIADRKDNTLYFKIFT